MFSKIRYAIRQLGRTPGFTATAIATLALCLGANFAIFAVVDAILVRSLPFPQPDRLVTVFNGYPGAGVERSSGVERSMKPPQQSTAALSLSDAQANSSV